MTIGYIGLGAMGGAVARRLLQTGEDLLVYDKDAAAVQRLAQDGAVPCAEAAELCRRSDVVLLCLPTSDHVREVLFGDGGLAAAAAPGTLIVDQTSGDPAATRAMAAELASRGIGLIDAPVSGGASGAAAGTLAIMVGAPDEQYARVLPVLARISPNVFHAGDVGAGHVVKLVNNLLSTAQRLLTFEGVALAAKNGVDPRRVVEILAAGGGQNAYLEKIMGPLVLRGRLDAGFTLALAHKDVGLACQLGVDSGVPMFFGNLTRELYQACIRLEGAEAKVDRAALVIDRLAGTHVVPTSTDHG